MCNVEPNEVTTRPSEHWQYPVDIICISFEKRTKIAKILAEINQSQANVIRL